MDPNIHYLELHGSHRARGRQHGEALRDLIRAGIESWAAFIEEETPWSFDRFLADFLAATHYRAATERFQPGFHQEVEGISEGANVPFERVYAWQLVDEWIDFAVEGIHAEKCSSLGGWGQVEGAPPLVGKTQDLPPFFLERHALIRTRSEDTGIRVLHSTLAGTVASDGLNDAGLALCLNHVGALASDPHGVPVAPIVQQILERCRSIDEALNVLKSVGHASGMNYLLGDRTRVASFEVTSKKVAEFAPAPELRRVWHTNHPLVNDDHCIRYDVWRAMTDRESGNTKARYATLERESRVAGKPLTLERVVEILSSREAPISALPGDDYPSVNAVIMECGARPVLHFAPGAPSAHAFSCFDFEG